MRLIRVLTTLVPKVNHEKISVTYKVFSGEWRRQFLQNVRNISFYVFNYSFFSHHNIYSLLDAT